LDPFLNIQTKLEKFIKRFYFSALIKGSLLFFCLGALYAIFWTLIEHFFWLPTEGRSIIFWCLVIFELYLFYKFILTPALEYLQIRKTMDHETAAELIGIAFPEIKDKLLNTVQLQQQAKSELLLASIEQKALQFNPFSFESAVKLKENLKYLKYALAPLLILAPFYLFGKQATIESSFKRMLDYRTSYTMPAPFSFILLNSSLQTTDDQSFTLEVKTRGRFFPDDVQIEFNNEKYFLKKSQNNLFSYTFENPKTNLSFNLFSGEVRSKDYSLEIIKTPKIINSRLEIVSPPYTNLKYEAVSNFTNITVPEGSKLSWSYQVKATESMSFSEGKTINYFTPEKKGFFYTKQVFVNFEYRISTNNLFIKDYETMSFSVDVIKDKPPLIEVECARTFEPQEVLFFYGQMSDDYDISKLQAQYYPKANPKKKTIVEITNFNKSNLTFSFVFPGETELNPDTAYELYFEVFDNYPYPAPNKSRSPVFTYQSKSDKTIINEQIDSQKDAIESLEEFLPNIENQDFDLDLFNKQQKQQRNLEFNDRQRLKDFLSRQEKQNEIIKNFNKKINESLKQLNPSLDDPKQDELKKRLEIQNKRLEKDEQILKELNDLSKKIDKEDLANRLENIAKQNKNKKRSLEQMLELTKRYYVRQKTKQLNEKLLQLSDRQNELAKQNYLDNTSGKQNKINQEFDDLINQFGELKKKNNTLSSPVNIPDTTLEQESIKKDLQEAQKSLKKKEGLLENNKKDAENKNAQKAQTKASQKMRQTAQQMAQKMTGGGQQELQEDIEMIRRILDNLLIFSFNQEALLMWFKQDQTTQLQRPEKLIKQKTLRTHFEHIDDSLLVVSLRQPLLGEKINNDISEVFYNIDKALDMFSNDRPYQGVAAQQYAVTATNSLADLLSSTLSSIEMQMNPGEGEGDMQLPDIIMTQDELNKQGQGQQPMPSDSPPKPSDQKGKKQGKDGDSPGNSSGENGNQGKPKSNSNKKQQDSDEFSDSEESSQAVMRLYQQQQQLRNSLEKLLREKGFSTEGERALEAMKKLEQQIINQGLNPDLAAQREILKYELLKLQTALKKQGKSDKRNSKTNKEIFNGDTQNQIDFLRRKLNTRDKLNRQLLPLQKEYSKRVLDYFNLNYDQPN
tara:strand:+ start:3520 stop:6915 length:3396 start_codon:yes stop_codon:yes gene_type:complete